jgi:hypothetical protein
MQAEIIPETMHKNERHGNSASTPGCTYLDSRNWIFFPD